MVADEDECFQNELMRNAAGSMYCFDRQDTSGFERQDTVNDSMYSKNDTASMSAYDKNPTINEQF